MLLVQCVVAVFFISLPVLAQKSCTSGECGPQGRCKNYGSQSRCKCSRGWMGINCKRPCQDIYKSCERWQEEGRCTWLRRGRTLFFADNCAATCKHCRFDESNQLERPFPPLMEKFDWLVGHWETETQSGDRFPMDTLGPYTETMIFQHSDITMFDRPSFNFTAVAQTKGDPTDLHWDVGFMTAKLTYEDTGFLNRDRATKDEVGLEINSNTGINTVEEGDVGESYISLKTTWKKTLPFVEDQLFKSAKRIFRRIRRNQLEEKTEIEMANGQTKKFSKRFSKVKDILQLMK